MAKTVVNVMRSIPPYWQERGMTLEEIKTQFIMAGYGLTKASKRVNELRMSAQIQSDGSMRSGELVYWCIFWPKAPTNKTDMNRVGFIEYEDPRHTILRRLDGLRDAWLNVPAEE